MTFNIDLDRGVHTRIDPQTGMDVHMYVDEPGVYRSSHGTEVGQELARRAGFEVDRDMKQRRVQLALSAARDKVLQEMADYNNNDSKVLEDRDGFKLIDIGYDRYQVLSPDGDVLTPTPLGMHEAEVLMDQLVPQADEEPSKEK